jgi:hypothetical protein
MPTEKPTISEPTEMPTNKPTALPTESPTTLVPTRKPTAEPTLAKRTASPTQAEPPITSSELICANWCWSEDLASTKWEKKCTWKNCNGCEPCSASLVPPTAAPTQLPTEERKVPEPTSGKAVCLDFAKSKDCKKKAKKKGLKCKWNKKKARCDAVKEKKNKDKKNKDKSKKKKNKNNKNKEE